MKINLRNKKAEYGFTKHFCIWPRVMSNSAGERKFIWLTPIYKKTWYIPNEDDYLTKTVLAPRETPYEDRNYIVL